MMKTLNFWDMDGTLIDSPLPESGKIAWEAKYGKPYPHKGWWSKPESLDLEAHDIKTKQDIFLKWKDAHESGEAINILLTSRLKQLESTISKVLSKHGIVMDYYSFAHGPLNKGQRVLMWLDHVSPDNDIKEINVYEDRDIEIQILEAVRSEVEAKGVKYNIHKVD